MDIRLFKLLPFLESVGIQGLTTAQLRLFGLVA